METSELKSSVALFPKQKGNKATPNIYQSFNFLIGHCLNFDRERESRDKKLILVSKLRT